MSFARAKPHPIRLPRAYSPRATLLPEAPQAPRFRLDVVEVVPPSASAAPSRRLEHLRPRADAALSSLPVPAVSSVSAYASAHRHFLVDDLNPLLRETVEAHPREVVADLGTGDGAVLWYMNQRGLLGDVAYAVDLSAERVSRAERRSPRIRGIVADATSVIGLGDESVDGVIVSQVIEHLGDDRALAPELARILRPGGWWYVGSVVRGRHAWWIYRVNGTWRVDPTHTREYASASELLRVLRHEALRVDATQTSPLRFPIIDLLIRCAAFVKLIHLDRLSGVYLRHPHIGRLRSVKLRIPGYHLIEITGRRRSDE
jgi:SAM-dependent methyltransferase